MNRRITAGGCGLLLTGASALAVPPTINVTWAESPPPFAGVDYIITDAGTDTPDVQLVNESETWKVWSVDTDNPNNIGDIGDITAVGAFNYGLTLEDATGGPGVRNIGKISLDPSSATKFSKIVGGTVTGSMTGDLFLQISDGDTGGTLDFTIEGNLLADATIPEVNSLTIKGDFGAIFNGNFMNIEDVVQGTITIEGSLRDSYIDISHLFHISTLQIGIHASSVSN